MMSRIFPMLSTEFIKQQSGIRVVWLFCVSCLIGCASFEESGLPGSASSMARDKMMLVREEPSTFGHYRLSSLMRAYPDIDIFIDQTGLPDFLAETQHEDHEYLIFYYLEKREAYVCRARFKRVQDAQFAGPYPITDTERQVLQEFSEKHDLQSL